MTDDLDPAAVLAWFAARQPAAPIATGGGMAICQDCAAEGEVTP